MKTQIKTATLFAATVGIVNLVLLMSSELNERAYSWLLVGLLNLLIAPGVYISLALDPQGSAGSFMMFIVIASNMAIYFVIGNIIGYFWRWVKKTA